MNTLCEKLKETPLFAGTPCETIRDFIEPPRLKTCEKGEDLFSAGDPADRFFYVVEGWIKLYRLSRDGDEVVIAVIAPGETFAEAAVFGKHARHFPVSAQAVEKTTVLEISAARFIEKIRDDSDFALMLLGSISQRQRYLVQQIEQLTGRSAPQRIGCFLLRLSGRSGGKKELNIALPYDKSLISARLNIKPETFSRALAKLEDYGVHAKGRTVHIEAPQKLAEFCEYDWLETAC
ncbi:MAG: Crp/Fnr family transcriptional regulator [Rhodospirillales bacterium]|nr:Crp/Fnr family transcriptional regulator [Rhodospirillales bacterium]